MAGSFGKAYQIWFLLSHRSYAESICCFSVIQTDKAASMAGKKKKCNSVSTTPSPNKHILFYPPTLPNHWFNRYSDKTYKNLLRSFIFSKQFLSLVNSFKCILMDLSPEMSSCSSWCSHMYVPYTLYTTNNAKAFTMQSKPLSDTKVRVFMPVM